MRKLLLLSSIIILSFILISCSSINNEGNDALGKGDVEEPKKHNGKNDEPTDIVVKKISVDTVNRTIEGMEEEVTINKFEILPFGIAYELDDVFGNPEVRNGIVKYSINDGEYVITMKVIENKTIDEVVEMTQKELDIEQFEEISDLQEIRTEENSFRGKMQYFLEPMTGYYVYEIAERLLVITYQYPVEAGDGMGPLLQSFRESIHLD